MKVLTLLIWLATGLPVCAETWQERALAAVLLAEAGGEGRVGIEAVAEVVRNRCQQQGWSIQRVITAPQAFSCLNGTDVDHLYARMRRRGNWQLGLEVAQTLYRHPARLPARVHGATHYDRVDRRPYWTVGAHLVAVVGRHAFWRLT
jgi:spore germination cell wall hydrolase CwlJ-like protein